MTTKPNPLLCMKTHLVYDNITVQLSKQNTRFQYNLVKKDSFKIYVSDVGLLCASLQPTDIATTIGPQSVVQKLISLFSEMGLSFLLKSNLQTTRSRKALVSTCKRISLSMLSSCQPGILDLRMARRPFLYTQHSVYKPCSMILSMPQ